MKRKKQQYRSYVDIVNSSFEEVESESSDSESRNSDRNSESSNLDRNSDQDFNYDSNRNIPNSESTMNTSGNSSNNQSSDNPGLMIVNIILDGKNYNLWKRALLLAISAKRKTIFIMKNDEPADRTSDAHLKWKETDDLVFSWILNSLTKELAAVFIHAKSAQGLWKEIEQRYGESNGTLIFQLRKEICSSTQGGMSLVDFFNKMKMMWDEYAILKPIENCTCGESRKLAQTQIEDEQLMQFLSGLNAEFDHVRDQILIMEPLPPVNKAFLILSRIEKQRSGSTNNNIVEFVNMSAGGRKQGYNTGYNSGKNGYQAKNKSDKVCTYCRKEGHERQDCFRIKGYPDWFKGKRITGPAKHQANMTQEPSSELETPLSNCDFDDSEACRKDSMQEMLQKLEVMQREVQRAIKGKQSDQEFSAFAGFAGACAGPEM
ncbi:uncharacterized protein [Euphorbia lathyris]|uniref:uncharacterized protein n=1 Tax=Euphorbia lathyris TaxID=212925 RepID=UPI0033130D53